LTHPRIRTCALLALATVLFAACSQQAKRYAYPLARPGDHVDVQHGRQVPDPYRALEDPAAPETRAWVEAQNELTRSHLDSVASLPAIRARLAEVWNHERYGVPLARAGRYFFTRNDGLQNQSVLLVADALGSEPRVLLDPNLLSPDGTTALSGAKVSDDGKLLAYGVSKAGSDWQ
jgi:prolyl oligopeptidase